MAEEIPALDVPPSVAELGRLIEMARRFIDDACGLGDAIKAPPSDRFSPRQVRGY